MSDQLANAAKLIGEPARAAMLMELMSGRALPAGVLASAANVTPQTASEHLAQLMANGFVNVHRQGRHRYYSLAAPEVADAIESILALTVLSRESVRPDILIPPIGTLAHARTCYAHLAGWVGVAITDALQNQGHLLPSAGRRFALTERGKEWFKELGVSIPGTSDLNFARQCLDWTERRPHLAGKLGVAMYKRFLVLRWIEPGRTPRAIRITLKGRQSLSKYLRIAVG